MAQSPNTSHGGTSQLSKVRLPSTKTVQPIRSQPPAWQWRWKQSPMPSAGLPQEVTVRSHMPSYSQIQWACYRKWKMAWETQTGMYQWLTSTFQNSCGCTVLDMADWRETTPRQTDWRAKQPSQAACFSEDLKCWDTICGNKTKDITPSIAWRRGVERGSARWPSLKGRERAIFNTTNIGTVSKATFGKRLRDEVERTWAFPIA